MALRSDNKNSPGGRVHTPISHGPALLPEAGRRRDWLFGLILILGVVLAYQPVWYAGFIWDDDDHLTANPCIVGPLGFAQIWTTRYADISPFTRSTFWLEHALWGLAPVPYHVVNVFIHGAGAVVLWRVLRRLSASGAWLGAAIWALHPVQVESVAWISEMKNTESGLFFLLSILFFAKWLAARDPNERGGNGWPYALMLLFAALAMTSKSSAVVLPPVLCLWAWWIEGRWQWKNLARVAPVILLSLAASALAMWTQGLAIATAAQSGGDPTPVRTWPERLVMAGDAVWFYLGKLAWPHPLITLYPGWTLKADRFVSYLPLLGVVLVLFILWLRRESPLRPLFFVFAYFLVALLPALGLFDNPIFRYAPVFDHLQYLASMGPLALAGIGLARLANFTLPGRSGLPSILAAGLLSILGLLSWQRAWAYQSEETLWSDTLAKNPNAWLAHYNLALVLAETGRIEGAITQYEQTLVLHPVYTRAHDNLGLALVQAGRVDDAVVQYRQALQIDPNDAKTHNNLGIALALQGRADDAMAEYRRALEINPNLAEIHNSLGVALLQKGRPDEAAAEYQKALELNPRNAEAHYNLGIILVQKGRLDEAIDQYQQAVAIHPDYAKAHANLGVALAQKGEWDQAVLEFEIVVRLEPDDPTARNNLARAQAMARPAAGAQ